MSIQHYQLVAESSSSEEAEERTPWIQTRKKFRNVNLRALRVSGRILLGVYQTPKQQQSYSGLRSPGRSNSTYFSSWCVQHFKRSGMFCQSQWKVCYFKLDIFQTHFFIFYFDGELGTMKVHDAQTRQYPHYPLVFSIDRNPRGA